MENDDLDFNDGADEPLDDELDEQEEKHSTALPNKSVRGDNKRRQLEDLLEELRLKAEFDDIDSRWQSKRRNKRYSRRFDDDDEE